MAVPGQIESAIMVFLLPSFWRVQQERHVEWMMNSILNVDALTSAMFRAPA